MREIIEQLQRRIETLQASEDFLQLSQRIASVGSWDWDFATGRVVWSDEMYRIFGISREQFDGTPEQAAELFHPEDREQAAAAVRAALEHGRSSSSEFRVLRPDGGVRHVWGQGEVLRDDQGRPCRMVGTILDVTERKLVERALRRSDQRLGLALSAARMGTWEWDPTTNRASWSPEAEGLLGFGRGAFDGGYATYLDRVHPEDRAHVRDSVTAALGDPASEGDFEVEHRVVRPSGEVAWLFGKGRVIRDTAGRLTRVAGALIDVSERKRLEEELRQSHRLESVGRLAGGIAHDFNNLLTVILGATTAASEEAGDDSRIQANLEMIRSAADHAGKLTSQLLAFARRQVIQLRVVDLNVLIGELEELLGRVLGEDVDFQTELGSELWRVRADTSQVGQVLVNLAANARAAMPGGGRLVVRTSNLTLPAGNPRLAREQPPGDYVRIVVRDTGRGMDEQTRRRAFEPFFTRSRVGYGLGLASSYGIVRQIGGFISIDSAPGRGTSFVVDLPRTLEPLEEQPSPSDTAMRAATETVLVVEDDPTVREMIVRGLESFGHEVLEASTGEEALEIVATGEASIDAVVTDTVMPGMSGRELARRLRERRPDTRLLLISGYTDEFVSDDDLRDLEFLAKPFTPSMLVQRLRDLLDR